MPCGTPPPVDNSQVSFFTIDNLVYADYICDDGFSAEGETVRMCSGTWDTNIVNCMGVSCGLAPQVNHASVKTTGHAYRDTATYTCNAGYFMNSSSSVMTCLANGTWSVELVTCAPLMCDSSTLPTFSEIIQQDDEIKIKCVVGYTLFTTPVSEAVMSTNLKCSEGNWTTVFDHNIICLPDYCTELPLVQNSVVELWNEPFVKAKHVCLSGYGFEAIPDQSSPGVSEQVAEFSIYCFEDKGWDIPPMVMAECVPVGCGPIYLLVESGLQAPPTYSSLPGSNVTLSCRPPLYQNVIDASSQNVVQCLEDGNWSLDNVTLTCAPCNQSKDAAGIPNSILEVNSDAMNIGDTAELSCASDFMLPGVSRTVQCDSVNGSPTWLGLEDAICLKVRWVNPETARNIITVPVYLELMTTGLEAYAKIQVPVIENRRVFVGLEEVYKPTSKNIYPARAVYELNSKGITTRLSFDYTTLGKTTNIVSVIDLDPALHLSDQDSLSFGDTATLCVKLNLTANNYQFSKNGKTLMEVDVRRYEKITYFGCSYIVKTHEINITYF
ncbi:hypothetical protein RRG08_040510 [Elysia crispata]|uniref:Sushi domain-containing protein n=1 Tax=Elysia crispata TaxID=231223 RepID=A0AAE0Z4Z6_9GAST|nr:hypothetical protein RRG08_040510 [Elysia crispata]